jgi:EmrB/QacA subfamily drug resistance transporter
VAPVKARVLVVLGAAQFLMVLDQAVMNVSISQLVTDFHTDVTTIQAVITFYSLVMAALMITGGKLGDRLGRRRAFTIGMVIYGVGSLITALSRSVLVLALGWSLLEGIGAALVLPALAALVAGNFEGRDRAEAYGILGGLAGAGIAVGPILGGWVTTNLTWRVVFLGEVVVVVAILALMGWIADAPRDGEPPEVDWVGAVLSAVGLGLVVYGVLQSSTWGWVSPRNSPITIFGFSLTLYVIVGGAVVLAAFVRWQRHRESQGRDPLVRLDRLRLPALRSGLWMFLAQNLILMGTFFVVPLYLQVVQGYDAFETGLRMLPVSVTLFAVAMSGPLLARYFGPRRVIRAGLVVLMAGAVGLVAVLKPVIVTTPFLVAMGVIGVGIGLLSSQLGNVVQSSVGAEARSEAGGLQYTSQQFGAALGTALIGAVVIGALAAGLSRDVSSDSRLSASVKSQVGVQLEAGTSFVPVSQVAAGLHDAGVSPEESAVIVEHYSDSQLQALRAGLMLVALVALAALAFTGGLPRTGATADPDDAGPDEAGEPIRTGSP